MLDQPDFLVQEVTGFVDGENSGYSKDSYSYAFETVSYDILMRKISKYSLYQRFPISGCDPNEGCGAVPAAPYTNDKWGHMP